MSTNQLPEGSNLERLGYQKSLHNRFLISSMFLFGFLHLNLDLSNEEMVQKKYAFVFFCTGFVFTTKSR